MTILGRLAGETDEPITDEAFARVEKRLRDSWEPVVTVEKRELEQLLEQIRWQRERLRRIEDVLEPLMDTVTSSSP